MSSYKRKKTLGDTEWFTRDRFGMFIHFGLYALPARIEWVQSNERMSEERYKFYFDHFNPDLFDADEWADYAAKAGMKYAVLTTKHHEGFCLFDSKYTDFKITNTPFGRDLVKEFVEAFRKRNIKVGFYYSLIDWHHPEFTIDMNHPLRDHPKAEEISNNRNMSVYCEYMRNQVRELLTNYGDIDIMWFDYSYDNNMNDPRAKAWMGNKRKNEWESEKLIELVRSIRPNIIINNRADIEQDLWTPEQFQPEEWVKDKKTGELVTWEACHTFSGSWGYHREQKDWKSAEQLIGTLIKTVSLGGNLIMNVGPTGRGNFDKRAEKALNSFADWMKLNGRSIYGCTMAEPEFIAPNGCRLTQSEDGKRLYIHLLEYPFYALNMDCLAGRIEYMQFLHDASELFYRQTTAVSGDVEMVANTIMLPTVKPDVTIPVIEVFLKDK